MKDFQPPPPAPQPTDSSDIEEMVNIAKELKATEDPDARERLLVELAEFGLRSHDFSDTNLCERCHEAFAEFHVAQQQYHMLALRVGRILLDVLPDELEPDDDLN